MKIKALSFGGCKISRISPGLNKVWLNIKTLNVIVGFEEALKLNLAIDECVRKMNQYAKNTREGKRVALNIVIHFNLGRLAIQEDKV